jgi:tRNA-dihydrouridine synthase C
MLMIGRGAVRDPGLGLAIKADRLGGQAAVSWPALLPLIDDFWHIVCSRIEPRARAGRLKQWLNFLRRRFPEAETAYQAIKTVNDPVLVQAWLVQTLRSEGLERPAVRHPLLEAA